VKKNDTLRVAVVEKRKQLTSVWRFWRWEGDVYVAPRAIAGSYKISLHKSGKYRFGFVSDQKAAGFLRPGEDRAVF
jgi:hypothetical protein